MADADAAAAAAVGSVMGPAGTGPAGRDIRRAKLDSGLRIVTEALPALRSVSIGFWVGVGSRDEREDEFGASHFLEHLLFKGTADRTASQIAHAVESVGGDMNAFTAQEMTSFYVRVPDDQLDLAIDTLADVIWAPALRPTDVEAERNVILEEIRMRDDAPDDLVHELFSEAMFPDHPLGREVLGSEKSITDMTRDSIEQFHGRNYGPSEIVVAAAGNLDHDHVVDRLSSHPAALRYVPQVDLGRSVQGLAPAQPRAVLTKPGEQVHVIVGTRGIPRDDPDRYPLTVLNQALGGGMSSRLFQEVRERRGLAYSVYSYRMAYLETGAFGVYVGTAPSRVAQSVDVIDAELDRVIRDRGISNDELSAAKGHLKGSMALSLETSNSRMHRLGSSELMLGEAPSLDDVVARVDAVTSDDVARVVSRLFSAGPRTLAVVGPVDEAAIGALG
ncbi:MAG TPA: pitrilysin family protein [Acidimicrobiia bacterium]|nr:pitrilysin family protein [Acidimicrobiia bacterium]